MELETLLSQVAQPDGPRVCVDSRQIRPGDVFVAIPGTRTDGHDFIDQALASGAAVVVGRNDRLDAWRERVETVTVDDPRVALGHLAQAAAGHPAREMILLAVTGTNGKTSVAFLAQACLQAAGRPCGLIGTIHCDTGREIVPARMTTPDALALADWQRRMVRNGCQAVAMEVSSHALDQRRVAGLSFHAAAFTHLSGDHLDYHRSMAQYFEAKARLFEDLAPGATAVLNADAPDSVTLARRTRAGILWYGLQHDTADLAARIEAMTAAGTRYRLTARGRTVTVHSPLLGRFNVSNHLAAAGLALAAGVELDAMVTGLEQTRIPGRLERVSPADGPTVLVDYAHTDDALDRVLEALRPLCAGRLIVLFGCGGDRDRSKRPRMAAAAHRWADVVVVTSDNPRHEDPAAIIAEIQAGFPAKTATPIHCEPDRAAAIAWALDHAEAGDVVLLAGKGHETTQTLGHRCRWFDDREVARRCLAQRRTVRHAT